MSQAFSSSNTYIMKMNIFPRIELFPTSSNIECFIITEINFKYEICLHIEVVPSTCLKLKQIANY